MKSKAYLSITLASALLFSACGGGGGGGGSSSSKGPTISGKQLVGTVIDPEIYNADVWLECGSKKYYSTGKSSKTGKFLINNIPESLDYKNCTLVSEDGIDGGDDLEGLNLKAPMNMFNSNDEVFITPITTLVANHDSTQIDTAVKEVADFLDISDVTKLKSNPVLDINIAKKAKKITRIALSENKNTKKKLGFDYIDIDDTSKVVEKKFDAFISKDLPNMISQEDKDELNEEFEIINEAKNKEDILLGSFRKTSKKLLFEAYKLKKDDANFSTYKKNIDYFSQKIAKALKKENSSFNSVNRFIIRRAMSDALLTATFNDDKSLKSELYTALTQDESNFKTYLDSKTLNLKDINGIELFNVNTDIKIVNNNNDDRITYYTFSNISHVGEALEIAKTSYDDNVLDPIYKEIATGYLNLGFYHEALEIANKNIYGDGIKISTLSEFASYLIKANEKEYALETLNNAYEDFKVYAKARGEENLSDDNIATLLELLNSYNNLKNTDKTEEVIEYIDEKILTKNADAKTYNHVISSVEILIEKAIKERNTSDFNYFVDTGVTYAKKVPKKVDDSGKYTQALEAIFKIVPYTAYTNKFSKGQELLTHAKSINETEYNTYKGIIQAFEILSDTNKMNETVSNFKEEADTSGDKYKTRRLILENGLALALIKNNQINKAVELITNNFQYRDKIVNDKINTLPSRQYNKPQVLKFFAKDGNVDLTEILGLVDKKKQSDFVYEIYKDSKDTTKPAWDFYRTYNTSKDKNKDIIISLFDSSYSSSSIKLIGYPVIIKTLLLNNEIDKAREVITYVLEYIEKNIVEYTYAKDGSLANPNPYKIKALMALLKVLEEAEYFKKVDDNVLKDKLNTTIKDLSALISLNNTNSYYKYELKRALSIVKFLAKNNDLDEARKLLQKASISLAIPNDANLDEIEKYLNYYLGEITNSSDLFSSSVLSAYIEAKLIKKTDAMADDILDGEAIIELVRKKMESLPQSLDKNELLVTLARAYGAINKKDKGLEIVNLITTIKEKNEAKLALSKFVSKYDAFPSHEIASVDTDEDGKPDFFNKFASKEDITKSKLILDDDIDGDGSTDDVDKYPYDKTKN